MIDTNESAVMNFAVKAFAHVGTTVLEKVPEGEEEKWCEIGLSGYVEVMNYEHLQRELVHLILDLSSDGIRKSIAVAKINLEAFPSGDGMIELFLHVPRCAHYTNLMGHPTVCKECQGEPLAKYDYHWSSHATVPPLRIK